MFVFASNYFMVLIPQTIRDSLDYIFEILKAGTENIEKATLNAKIIVFAGMVIGFALLRGFFMYYTRQTIIVMSRLIEYDLRKEIFAKYESLDTAFFKKNKTGDLMVRISEDVSKVRMYIGPVILYGANLFSIFFLVIYAMFQVNPTLSFYTLLPLPFLSVSIYYVSSIINKRSEIIQKQLAKLNSTSQEVYAGIRVIKSYAKESQFQQFFLEECEDYKEKNISLARVNAFFQPLMIILISLSTLITIYVGGTMVMNDEITPGNLAEFIIYINYLTWPFTAIGWMASMMQAADASQKRINEFLYEMPTIVNTNKDERLLKGNITFKEVSFTYADTGIKALDKISFSLAPGEKMAIIGKTASGKTTIADLILRLYEADEGEILIDGKNIKEVNLENLRNQIGYVPQDSFLFSDSVVNNIKFGNESAADDEVDFYAEKASIYEDIMQLPEKMQTKIGERGVTLSGGQKQRLSIARALIKNPEIVILDDSLSAVDANTENKILNHLNTSLKDKTTIVVTHRFYNLLSFDKIIVLENGKIVQSGTHEELIEKEGFYAEQYEQQMQKS